MTAVEPRPTTDLATITASARAYAEASRAENTTRAYRSDWRQFTAWCAARDLSPLPADPAVVALYLSDRAGVLAVATLGRHLVSIGQAHTAAGHDNPTRHEAVRSVWKGIRRTFGTASATKQALEVDDIRAMVRPLTDSSRDVRDRALVLVAFAAALRRSELVALDAADVAFVAEGMEVAIRRSKTDQDGGGVVLGVPYASDPACCPVRAMRRHLDVSGITDGPVFRGARDGARLSGKAAAAVVKRLAAHVGHDPAHIAGHSTRRGFITSAVKADVPERVVMKHSRHRSLTVFRQYVADAGVWRDNAAVGVGL